MIVFFSGGTSVPWQISIGLLILSSIFSTPFFGGGLVSFFQLDSYQVSPDNKSEIHLHLHLHAHRDKCSMEVQW